MAVNAGNLEASGALTITDADTGEAQFVSQPSVAGSNGHGTFSLDASGNWTYVADNAQTAIQELKDGDSLTDSFTAVSADGSASQVVTVTINGSNDGPTAAVIANGAADEDDDPMDIDMSLLLGAVTDVDAGDSHAVTAISTASGVQFTYDVGTQTLSINPDQFESLAAGDTLNVTFTATVSDVAGASVDQDFDVVITGENDGATISGVSTGGVQEDVAVNAGNLEASGALTITDADTGEAQFVSQPSVAGSNGHGTFSLDVSGNWTYVADNAQTAIQELKDGDSLTDSFTAVSADGSASQVVTVTISGTNDAPVANADVVANIAEDSGVYTISAALILGNDTDVDASDTKVITAVSVQSGGGTAVLNGGDIEYTPALDFNGSVVLNYTMEDSAGSQSSSTISFDVTAVNDAPVVSVSIPNQAGSEDTAFSFSIPSNTFADVDLGDSLTLSLESAPAWLSLTGDVLSGTPPLNFNGIVSVTIRATDIAGAFVEDTFTITIAGVNDTPIVVNESATLAEDDADVMGNVLTNDSDPDDGPVTPLALDEIVDADIIFNAQVIGTVSIALDGAYTISLNAAADAMSQGDQVILPVNYDVTDGLAIVQGTLTVTVNGSNDGPTAAVIANGAADEDDDPMDIDMSLLLGAVTDVDAGDSHTVTAISTASGVQFTYDVGTQTLSINPDQFESLAAGDTLNVTFTATVSDVAGASVDQDFDVVITGENDGATISGVSTGGVQEDVAVNAGNLEASGALTITDADTGEAQFVSQPSVAGSNGHGTFSLDVSGNWTYVADNAQTAIQELKDGDSLTDSFTAVSADGSASQVVTVTISGTNDAPVANADVVANIAEDSGVYTISAALILGNDTDVDASDTKVITAVSVQSGGGTAVLNGGDIEYTPALDFNGSVVLNYTMEDSAGSQSSSTISFDVTAVNDAPVVSVSIPNQAGSEDTAFSFSIPSNTFADVDLGDSLTLSLESAPAWLSLTGDVLSGTPPLNFNGIVSVTIRATDIAGAFVEDTFTITIAGVNDTPIVVNESATLAEDDADVMGNVLTNDSDPDDGPVTPLALDEIVDADIIFNAQVIGTVSIALDGAYTISLNAAADAMSQGDQVILPVNYDVTDGLAIVQGTLTVTVNGSNDGPTAAVIANGAADEDDDPMDIDMSLLLGAVTDVDAGDSHTVTAISTASGVQFTYGVGTQTLSINPDQFESLAAGDTLNVTFTATVSDVAGASVDQDFDVVITGENDGATISGVSTGGVQEDVAVNAGNLEASGALTITDADTGEAQFVSQPSVAGSNGHGTFSLDAAGNWTYVADNAQTAIQELGVGETLSDSFTAVSHDGTASQIVTVTISGTNDAPTVVAIADAVYTDNDLDDSIITTDLLLGALDIDAGSTLSVENIVVTNDENGAVSVLGNNDLYIRARAYDQLQVGDPDVVITVNFDVFDGVAYVPNSVNIVISGANDAPIVSVNPIGEAFEDAAAIANDGNVLAASSISDSDSEFAGFTAVAQSGTVGMYGTLTLNADGSYDYVLDDNNAAVNALQVDSAPLIDSFAFTINDGNGGSAVGSLAIEIKGSNDAPTASVLNTVNVGENSIVVGNGNSVHADFFSIPLASIIQSVTDADDISGFTLQNFRSDDFVMSEDGVNLTISPLDPDALNDLDTLETFTSLITVDVVDPHLGILADQTFNLVVDGVTDINLAPIVVDELISISEDDADLTGNVLDNDADQDAFTILTVDNPGITNIMFNATQIGTVTLNADGSYVVSMNAAAQAMGRADAFDLIVPYTVTDGVDSTAGNLTVNVRGSNDAPVVTATLADITGVTEDSSILTIPLATLFATGSDIDVNDNLTTVIESVQGAVFGTVNITATDLEIDPSTFNSLQMGESATLVVNIAFSDQIDTVFNTQTIIIDGVNDNPVVNVDPSQIFIYENADNIDVDGNLLQDSVIVDVDDLFLTAAAGTFTGNYGTLVVSENGDYDYQLDNANTTVDQLNLGGTLTETFTFTINDDNGGSGTGTLNIQIEGANDAPVVANSIASPAAINEEGNFFFTIPSNTFSDVDGPNGILHSVHPSWLSFDSATGEYSGTAPVDFSGSEVVIVEYSDGSSGSAFESFVVVVNPVNDDPVTTNDIFYTLTEDSPVITGNVLDNDFDVDSDTLTIQNPGTFTVTNAGIPVGTVVLAANGDFTITMDAGAQAMTEGVQTPDNNFTYFVEDGDGGIASGILGVQVTGVNDLPSVSTPADIIFNDNDGTQYIPGVTYAPATDPDGTFLVQNISVRAGNDPEGAIGFSGSTVILDTSKYNHLQVGESVEILLDYEVNDFVGTPVAGVAKFVINGANDGVFAIPIPSSILKAEEGKAFELALQPWFLDHDDNVNAETETLSYAVSASTFGVPGMPSGLTYNPVTETIEGILGAGTGNTITVFTVVATDSQGATATSTFNLTVNSSSVDNAPTAGDDAVTIDEDSSGLSLIGNVLTNDSDPDGDTITLTNPRTINIEFNAETIGTITLAANGDYTIALNAAAQKMDSTDQLIIDMPYSIVANGANAAGLLTITLDGANDAPVNITPYNAPLGVTEDDAPFSISFADILASVTDADANDTLSVTNINIVNDVNNAVTVDANGLNIDPNAYNNLLSAPQSITVNFDISDGTDLIASSFILDINGINDSPIIIAPIPDSAAEIGVTNISIDANAIFLDPEGQPLTIVDTGILPSWLTFAGGVFTGTPDASFIEPVIIKVSAQDPNGGFVVDSFVIRPHDFESTVGADASNDTITHSGTTGLDNFVAYGDGTTVAAGETIGASDDTITGGAGGDTIYGDVEENEGGAGTSIALTGDDIIFGGAGDDNFTLVGDIGINAVNSTVNETGKDTIDGGTGNDVLIGDVEKNIGNIDLAGNDLLIGGADDDLIVGDVRFNESVLTTAGDDILIGGEGDDHLYGDVFSNTGAIANTGVDRFVYDMSINNGADRIYDFESGKDFIRIVNSGETVDIDDLASLVSLDVVMDGGINKYQLTFTGGQGSIILENTPLQANFILRVEMDSANDGIDDTFQVIIGSDNADVTAAIKGFGDPSLVYGFDGGDFLTSGLGNPVTDDYFYGGINHDTLVGDGALNAQPNAVAGNDVLDGGIGNDLIYGDYILNNGSNTTSGDDIIRGGEDDDVLYGDVKSEDAGVTGTTRGTNTFVYDLNIANGEDRIMDYNPTNDTLLFENMAGTTGADLLSVFSFAIGTPDGPFAGQYFALLDDAESPFIGSISFPNLVVQPGLPHIQIDLDTSNDGVDGSVNFYLGTNISDANAFSITAGTTGTNIIYGFDGDDALTGNSGQDFLIGGKGDDMLAGGLGNDVFVIDNNENTGADTITDFDPSDDRILLRNMGGSSFDAVRTALTFSIVGNDYVMDLVNGSSLLPSLA